MRNLKALGLAVVAVFATSAIAATAAAANQFHSASVNTTVTIATKPTQVLLLEEGGPKIQCVLTGGSGTVSAQTVTEVTFAPIYSNCSSPIGEKTEVIMNGCQYLLTIKATENLGPVHIKCPTEKGVQKQIDITFKFMGFSLCTYHAGEQTPKGNSDYTNNGVNRIFVQPTQFETTMTRQGSPECGSETISTSTYTGQVEVKGEITGQTTETNIQVG